MRRIARRRLVLASSTALVGSALVVAWMVGSAALRPVDRLTGWLLLGLCAFLAAFNLRKKLPFLPLGSASTWLQVHVYSGYLAIVVFALHLELRWPHGTLETTLAGLFVVVSLSGFVGLWLSRTLAWRLAGMGERFLYDRIPREREMLRAEAERLALESIDRTGERLIAQFHVERLHAYFTGPRHQLAHLVGVGSPGSGLREGLAMLRGYQEEDGREIIDRLNDLVARKSSLDRQLAAQRALRYWLFVHVPSTHALLVAIAVHVALVLGYGP